MGHAVAVASQETPAPAPVRAGRPKMSRRCFWAIAAAMAWACRDGMHASELNRLRTAFGLRRHGMGLSRVIPRRVASPDVMGRTHNGTLNASRSAVEH